MISLTPTPHLYNIFSGFPKQKRYLASYSTNKTEIEMVNTYKIQLDEITYKEIFEPFLHKNFLKLPVEAHDNMVEVTIRRTCVLEYLQKKIISEIDNYEVMQSEMINKMNVH